VMPNHPLCEKRWKKIRNFFPQFSPSVQSSMNIRVR
jgi:hypothetical protein